MSVTTLGTVGLSASLMDMDAYRVVRRPALPTSTLVACGRIHHTVDDAVWRIRWIPQRVTPGAQATPDRLPCRIQAAAADSWSTLATVRWFQRTDRCPFGLRGRAFQLQVELPQTAGRASLGARRARC